MLARAKKRGVTHQEIFAEEEAKSAAFLQKLTKIKKSNQESKKRTVVN